MVWANITAHVDNNDAFILGAFSGENLKTSFRGPHLTFTCCNLDQRCWQEAPIRGPEVLRLLWWPGQNLQCPAIRMFWAEKFGRQANV